MTNGANQRKGSNMAANKIFHLTRVEAQAVFIKEHKLRGEYIIPDMIHKVTSNGGEFMLHTGAKMYRRNGGGRPFMVIGYAYDDSDAIRALQVAGIAV